MTISTALAKAAILVYRGIVTTGDRIRFYQQLAVLSRAGVPMRGSFERLQGRFSSRQVALLSQQINAGERLGEAFTAAGFSEFECHLVAAGERSGQLDAIFEHLAEFWTRQREMRQALFRPLYYPIAVLHLALALLGFVLYVTGSPVKAVIYSVGGLTLAYLVGFSLYFAIRITWSSPAAQRIWLMVPLIGGTLSSAFAYRWITALRIEFTAGITLSVAVADAWRASGYVGSEALALQAQEALRQGTPLSKLIRQWKRLPRDWIDFVETGEVSGGLQEAFVNLETEAARNWRLAEQRMTEWVPKILYFFVMLIVGSVVFSLLYQIVVAPLNNVQESIDKALGN